MTWTPTQEQREMVRAMSGYGVLAADIARVVASAVPEAEFVKVCADELERGQIEAGAKLQEQLYTQAVNGNTAALLHLSRQSTGGQLQSIVSTAEMCSWLGVTKTALNDLKRRGVVETVSRDRWNVKATVRTITQHYRDVAAGRKAQNADAESPDLVTERALLAREQRMGLEMKNEQERGNLIPSDTVREEIGRIGKIVVRHVATVGDRLERDRRVSPEVVEYIEDVMGDLRDEIAREIGEGSLD